MLCSVRDCTGVAKFMGVVLDDPRLHLKSFIYESPGLRSIHSILTCAQSRFERISWSIKETWSKQIINAVSDILSKGLTVGGNFFSRLVGITADGSAVLTEFRTSVRSIQGRRGQMAPELRNETKDKFLGKQMTFRTEIFHLSNILWCLAAHHPAHLPRYWCERLGCATSPCSTWPITQIPSRLRIPWKPPPRAVQSAFLRLNLYQ